MSDLQRWWPRRQRVAFDAARCPAATVGGLLATGDAGPAQQSYDATGPGHQGDCGARRRHRGPPGGHVIRTSPATTWPSCSTAPRHLGVLAEVAAPPCPAPPRPSACLHHRRRRRAGRARPPRPWSRRAGVVSGEFHPFEGTPTASPPASTCHGHDHHTCRDVHRPAADGPQAVDALAHGAPAHTCARRFASHGARIITAASTPSLRHGLSIETTSSVGAWRPPSGCSPQTPRHTPACWKTPRCRRVGRRAMCVDATACRPARMRGAAADARSAAVKRQFDPTAGSRRPVYPGGDPAPPPAPPSAHAAATLPPPPNQEETRRDHHTAERIAEPRHRHAPRTVQLADCVHCGFCLPTCPTYPINGER
jgi:hypothetical protein